MHVFAPWRRARSVVYMVKTGLHPEDRNCTFVDALHECKDVYCAGQVLQFMVRAWVTVETRRVMI